jgi:tRNA(Ile)-lysidine synthase
MEKEIGPGIAEALARTASLLRDDADALDDIAAHRRRELDDQPKLTALAALPMAIRTRIIRAIAIAAGTPADSMGRDQVMAVDRLVTNPRVRGPIHLPGGCVAQREYGRLQIAAVVDQRTQEA